MAKRKTGGESTIPKVAGRYRLGEGLYLLVRSPTAASYFYRYTATVGDRKVRREFGLGPAYGRKAVSAKDAKIRALEASKLVDAGLDPVADKAVKRQMDRAAERQVAPATVTFWDACEAYIEAKGKNSQWEQSLRDHAKPLHKLAVGSITTAHVLAVVTPLWSTKNETASRLRGRIEAVLDAAKVLGQREGENPSRWKGHLEVILPARSKVRKVKHHTALGWRDVPALLADLTETEGVAARALAFTVLTAARTGEVIGARWSEIQGDVWIIPAERTKTRKEHRVPLSTQALAVLGDLAKYANSPGGYCFPSEMTDSEGRPYSITNMAMLMCLRRLKGKQAATVHGFRSSFRDWCADHGVPRELAEAALAHVTGGVEGAYYRSDVIELRRSLMQRWADHCLPPAGLGANVVPLVERLAGSGSPRA